MSNILGSVFSASDTFKRKLVDALRNPVAKAEQVVGDANDRARGFNELTSQATDAHLARLQSGERGMSEPEMRLAQTLADSYAMGGMITGGNIAKQLNAKYGDALDASLMEGDKVYLSKVVVPKASRGQGVGSKFMQDLVDAADDQGKTVTLTPSADFGGNKKRLESFYKRFGFVQNKGRTKDFEISEAMYRTPKQAATIDALRKRTAE